MLILYIGKFYHVEKSTYKVKKKAPFKGAFLYIILFN